MREPWQAFLEIGTIQAMAYPAVMLVMAIGVTIFLLTWVMPKFTPIFDSRGLKLPKPTQFLLNASNLLIGYWYFWVAVAVAGSAFSPVFATGPAA